MSPQISQKNCSFKVLIFFKPLKESSSCLDKATKWKFGGEKIVGVQCVHFEGHISSKVENYQVPKKLLSTFFFLCWLASPDTIITFFEKKKLSSSFLGLYQVLNLNRRYSDWTTTIVEKSPTSQIGVLHPQAGRCIPVLQSRFAIETIKKKKWNHVFFILLV